MLIVNLLNGALLASLVCFVVGVVLLAILAARSPGVDRQKSYPSRVWASFGDPKVRIARTLITAGATVAVASLIAVVLLSASLPRCAGSPADIDEAVALCMPVTPAPPV